jgi:hypothetical protein
VLVLDGLSRAAAVSPLPFAVPALLSVVPVVPSVATLAKTLPTIAVPREGERALEALGGLSRVADISDAEATVALEHTYTGAAIRLQDNAAVAVPSARPTISALIKSKAVRAYTSAAASLNYRAGEMVRLSENRQADRRYLT